MAKEKNNKKTNNIFLYLALGFFIFSIILFVAFSSNNSSKSNAGNVISNSDNLINKQNCKEIQVPYEEQEEYLKTEYYTETVPYNKEVDLIYDASHFDTVESSDMGGGIYGCGSLFDYAKCFRIMVVNGDTIGGIFNVKCNMRTLQKEFSEEKEIYVKPGEYEIVMCEANVDAGVDVELSNFKVIPPTKTELAYKDIQRERQVTAYRPVTKYKTETKCN